MDFNIESEYDNAGRIASMQDGILANVGKLRIYEYDGLGRLKRQSIAVGQHIMYDEVRNFYDDYSFLDSAKYSVLIPKNDVDGTDLEPLNRQYGHGQLTGTWQRASNDEPILTSYTYDDYGRIIMRKEIGLSRHLTLTGYSYNFVGDLKYEGFDFYQYDATANALTSNPCYGWITHNFEAAHTKLTTSSVIHFTDGDNNMCNAVGTYTYDDFGHVVRKSRSGAVADMTYEYDNLHGWVKRIASSGGFEQKLYRETDGQKTCFNGSISAMTWKIASNGRLRRFDYEYDGMNRLRNAEFGYYGYMETSDNSSIFKLISNQGGEHENYSVQYWYDKNSNIESIYRQGRLLFGDYDGYDTVEDDVIEYDGNQVVSYNPWACGDPYYSNFDFVNGADEDVEYLYDANGNLTQDKNKGLTFEYDLLGHPIKVSGSNNDIEYVYAPDGRKLRAVHKTYTSTTKKTVKTSTTKDYTNGYIFTNGKPSMFSFDGGYYSFDGQGKLNGCHYYIQDYQGNNRMVVNAATNRTEQVTHYYPYGELMADISTSPDAQQFKYGGKELDRSFGLDLYDFHARQQDAKLGRFNSIDPLAYKNPWASPYTYCNGDPVNQIDPDGECPVIVVTIVIGAVVGGVVSGTIAYANGARGKNFWGAVAGGVVSGAIMGSGYGLMSGGSAVTIAYATGFGAASSFSGNVVDQAISNNGEIDWKIAGYNAATGAVTGAITQSATCLTNYMCGIIPQKINSFSDFGHMSWKNLRNLSGKYGKDWGKNAMARYLFKKQIANIAIDEVSNAPFNTWIDKQISPAIVDEIEDQWHDFENSWYY